MTLAKSDPESRSHSRLGGRSPRALSSRKRLDQATCNCEDLMQVVVAAVVVVAVVAQV